MDWAGLVLDPAGSQEESLSWNLLAKLYQDNHVTLDVLMEPGPGLSLDGLPYEWNSDEEYGWNRGKKKTPMPVWAHWLFTHREKTIGEAAAFLAGVLPASTWTTPLYKTFSGLDWLAKKNCHEAMDQVLGRLPREATEEKRREVSRAGSASVHGSLPVETLKVLLRHGWAIEQQNREGLTAIETAKDAKTFLAILELGGDPTKGRGRIRDVADRAEGRQALLKAVNEKLARSTTKGSPQQTRQDEVAQIMESGVAGGFAAKLAKLSRDYPKAPVHGLMVGGRSVGGGMLRTAGRMSTGDRPGPKAKSYLSLCETLLAGDGNGWIKLDQPMVGVGEAKGMTDRDGMLLGAMVMLHCAKKGSRGKHWLNAIDIPASVERALLDWMPGMSQVMAQWEVLEPDAMKLHHLVNTLSFPVNEPLGRAAEQWWNGVGCDDPVMKQLLETKFEDRYGYRHSDNPPKDLEPYLATGAWPVWLANKVGTLNDEGKLDDTWAAAAAAQWKNQSTQLLIGRYRSEREIAMGHTLSWVMDDAILNRDIPGWEQWVHEIFKVKRPLDIIPFSLRTQEEDVLVENGGNLPMVALGVAAQAGRQVKDDDQTLAAMIRKLPMQLLTLKGRPTTPGEINPKLKM